MTNIEENVIYEDKVTEYTPNMTLFHENRYMETPYIHEETIVRSFFNYIMNKSDELIDMDFLVNYIYEKALKNINRTEIISLYKTSKLELNPPYDSDDFYYKNSPSQKIIKLSAYIPKVNPSVKWSETEYIVFDETLDLENPTLELISNFNIERVRILIDYLVGANNKIIEKLEMDNEPLRK